MHCFATNLHVKHNSLLGATFLLSQVTILNATHLLQLSRSLPTCCSCHSQGTSCSLPPSLPPCSTATNPPTNAPARLCALCAGPQEGDLLWFASDLDGVKYLRKEQRLEEAQAAQVAKLKIRQKYQSLLQVGGRHVTGDAPPDTQNPIRLCHGRGYVSFAGVQRLRGIIKPSPSVAVALPTTTHSVCVVAWGSACVCMVCVCICPAMLSRAPHLPHAPSPSESLHLPYSPCATAVRGTRQPTHWQYSQGRAPEDLLRCCCNRHPSPREGLGMSKTMMCCVCAA